MSFLRRWLRVSIPAETRLNVQVDFLAAAFFGAFGGLTTPFVPVMGLRIGASPLQVSLLVAAPAVVLLLSFWVANAIRPMHPVRLVVWPALIGRALFLLMPVIHTPGVYVLVIVLYHAISSINQLGYAQVMRTVYPDDTRGRIMALVRVGMASTWVVASLLGGQLMQLVPFQWVFAAAGLLGMASSLTFSRMRTPAAVEPPDHVSLARTLAVMRDDHSFRRFLAAFFIFGFGGWLIGPAIPILLVEYLHASNFQVGLLGAVTSGLWLLSYYNWGRMIDRLTPTGAMRRVFLIGIATPVIYMLAPNAWVVQLAGVTEGLTSAGIDLGWLTAVLQYAPAGQVLHYVTLFNTFVGIRAATAPFLAGALIPYVNVRSLFAVCVLLQLAGTWIMWRTAGPRARSNTA